MLGRTQRRVPVTRRHRRRAPPPQWRVVVTETAPCDQPLNRRVRLRRADGGALLSPTSLARGAFQRLESHGGRHGSRRAGRHTPPPSPVHTHTQGPAEPYSPAGASRTQPLRRLARRLRPAPSAAPCGALARGPWPALPSAVPKAGRAISRGVSRHVLAIVPSECLSSTPRFRAVAQPHKAQRRAGQGAGDKGPPSPRVASVQPP